MTNRWRWYAALLLLATACGGARDGQPASPPQPPASSGPAEVVGKLASTLAPPATLVTLEPVGPVGTEELPIKKEPAIIDQAGYEFLPGFSVVQAGQPVQFRNSEDVLHNVRVTESTAQEPVFNVATTAFNKYEHTFEPGYYNVSCDIHPTMRASILVIRTPYSASAGEDGRFSIAAVPPGSYKLTVFTGQNPAVRTIDVEPGHTDLGTIQ